MSKKAAALERQALPVRFLKSRVEKRQSKTIAYDRPTQRREKGGKKKWNHLKNAILAS